MEARDVTNGWQAGPADRRDRVRRRPIAVLAGTTRCSGEIGGRTGWYYGDWLWSLRGFLDLLCGGGGIRRRPVLTGSSTIDGEKRGIDEGDSIWSRKGATFSDKSARLEFGLT
jgi:hypothetical protein